MRPLLNGGTLGGRGEIGSVVGFGGRVEGATQVSRLVLGGNGRIPRRLAPRVRTTPKRVHGVWHRGKYEWHVFSFGDTFALALDSAREAYLAQPRSELVIIPNDKKYTGLRTAMIPVPSLDGEADIYISPPSLAWTMAYTHEDGWCGPYFSRAEWVDHPPWVSKQPSTEQKKGGRKKR
jgi:hypothetical protein